MVKECLVVRPGLVDYKRALELQEGILQLKREGNLTEDVAVFLQHPPTITVGKKGSLNELWVKKKELERRGILLYQIGRGGRLTFHGPGQLVGYPILNLADYGKDLHLYLRYLEEVIINTLGEFNVIAQRKRGLTGVWVGDKKIASIGVQVSRWISMHGFALNINCDLGYFDLFQPCGMKPQVMSSLSSILQKNIKVKEVEDKLISHFASVFSLRIKPISIHKLEEKINHQFT